MKSTPPSTVQDAMSQPQPPGKHRSFGADFRRFFTRGLAAILPTLITIWLVLKVWEFLWESLGQHLVEAMRIVWSDLVADHFLPYQPNHTIYMFLDNQDFSTQVIGVTLAVLAIYIVGIFVGNLIGRTFWRFAERTVMRVPLVRAIYPAVKQVTDFILAERSHQIPGSRVVACKPHEDGIWQIGMLTGRARWSLNSEGPEEMVTVFLPSTPTAFTGYVVIVPRTAVVELPMTVEEALRLLVSGGVIMPSPENTQRIDTTESLPPTEQTPIEPPIAKVG